MPGLGLGLEEAEEGAESGDARRWCICNQTSYGEMVACDNPNVSFSYHLVSQSIEVHLALIFVKLNRKSSFR